MDASRRRSWCLLGAVLVLSLLARSANGAGEPVVYFTPSVAVRGNTLEVNVFYDGDAQCTLTFGQDVYPIPSDGGLSFPFTHTVSVRVLVGVSATQVTATVTCTDESTNTSTVATVATVAVTSDVDLQFSWATNPSPADPGKPLTATFTLANRGGHPAVALQCSVTKPFTNLTCAAPGQPSPDGKTCGLASLLPNSSTTLLLAYDAITEDTDVSVECRAHNVPEPLPANYTIRIKADADVKIVTPQEEITAMAGSNFTVVTTIKNIGSAVADGLVCNLTIENPTTTAFVGLNKTECSPVVDTAKNATTGVSCTFGDLPTTVEHRVGLTLHVAADVEKNSRSALTWACAAEGLAPVPGEIKVVTDASAALALTLPANSSIEGGAQSLLFRLKNLGPSNLREGKCEFVLSKGVEAATWSQSPFFNCSHAPAGTNLKCDVTNFPPTDAEFNLGLVLKDLTLKQFTVNALCELEAPHGLNKTFTIDAGVKPSPSPAPSGNVAPAPDNTMMVVVTVIVALGLLIVMIIWWRKRQDAAGWEAAGPNPRSPSLNRFSDVELSVRSSD